MLYLCFFLAALFIGATTPILISNNLDSECKANRIIYYVLPSFKIGCWLSEER